MTGFVSLVGAGPGPVDLLTERARDRLERAELVLHDALVDSPMLDLAPGAQRFYVGKRAGRHAMGQRTIEALMVRHGRAGRRVVRLKAGDPFVLGRGGEEALALEAAGVPYEVVPGLSTAVVAPALAGVPVTHRGLSAAFLTLSGHDPQAFLPLLASLPAQGLTLVVLMGFRHRARIASELVARGWAGRTPVALIAGAGTLAQKVWTGALDELRVGQDFDPEGAPVTLTIGETVALASSWQTAPVLGAAPPLHSNLSPQRAEPS